MFSSPSQQPGQHRAAQVPHTGEGGAQVNVVRVPSGVCIYIPGYVYIPFPEIGYVKGK